MGAAAARRAGGAGAAAVVDRADEAVPRRATERALRRVARCRVPRPPLGPPASCSFVRARLLLEDESTGCVASFDGHLCVVLTHFSKAEHQLLLPLWPASTHAPDETFSELLSWHHAAFAESRLSGARLEGADDRAAFSKAEVESRDP